jgi:serine/threonine protein kinase
MRLQMEVVRCSWGATHHEGLQFMSAIAKSDPEVVVGADELPPAEPHPRRMLDRYEIIAQIAKGGMGTVYLARREGAGGFERLSAIKILHEHLAEDDTFVTMLLDEARTAAHIHHPNAIGIDDVAESPVGHYLVMAYVDGFNLAQIMTEPTLSENDRIRICARLIVDAANGLHAAHQAKNPRGEKLGIVHRDVSPQNVLVGTDGMGRIVDFGIALAASRIAASRPGTLKGKPQYMAPEQARGEPCDARTDVFALGVILWEALTLERLFYGEMDVAILVQVMDCIVPDPRERNPRAPAALSDVAMKALSKRREDRYASARELAVAVEKAGAAGLIAATSEVEETLARVFGAEMALKDEAVRRHLASSTGATEPLQKGQLGLVPRLLPKKLAPKRADLATRASARAEVPSGVRSRSGEMDAPVPDTALATPSITPPVPAPRAAPRSAALGLGLVIVGVVAIAVAVGIWLSSRDARTVVVTPAPPTSAVLSAPPTSAAEVPPTTTLGSPPTDVPATTTVEVAQPEDEHRHHGHGHVVAPPPSSTTVTPPPSTTSSPGSSMTIETNPYLTH